MNVFSRTYNYLDKEQHKRNNSDTITAGLFLIMLILFAPLVIRLIQLQQIPGKLPAEFSLSTILLLAGSWIIYNTKSQKEKDNYKRMQVSLSVTLLFGLLFLLFQYAGWQRLLAEPGAKSYKIILVIVLLHAVNFLVPFICLVKLVVNIWRIKSKAECFIFFLNPGRNSFFLTSRSYWEFFCFLWTGMYVVMLCKCL
jgi:cytochrome c oxidase subunit 3